MERRDLLLGNAQAFSMEGHMEDWVNLGSIGQSLRLSTHLWVIWCTNCQFRALRVVKLLPKISHETRIPVGDNCAGNSMKMNDLRNKCRRNCITRKIT
ncbi:hypothetical protein E1A91_D04G100700v1 [Gossypium mustelinum]|uniref:Uncharacterized protein n=1 Tax=Gossypium mustelinum TaxID=34275 RepID=A0A5D2VC57_GOSMU|nr:hypothetical protein E1A91_D04G100700v1 [Gossypium mustelinum]